MEERAYLSIGEVLALLKEEFPDVTISKIRFLESQGLLDPERTPSGYRKFYETDVERLQWILRQQREHFLPLKVIKGRLRGGAEVADEPAAAAFPVDDITPGAGPGTGGRSGGAGASDADISASVAGARTSSSRLSGPPRNRPLMTLRGRKCSRCWRRIHRSRSTSVS